MKNIENEINYRYWTVEEIRPYIMEHLKKTFPDSIIMREFDQVDIMVLGQNIPVEIQRTYVHDKVRGSHIPHIDSFENAIRKQIEQNIKMYEQCWFFFDSKFLDYLQNNLTRHTSLNMDWLYQFWKDAKLRLFTITIKGDIRELEDKDFDFIREFSHTCSMSEDEEHRIMARNKSKIAYNVMKKYGFTTDEINSWYDEYESNDTKVKGITFRSWLREKGDRKKKFSAILGSIGGILSINEMLKCNLKKSYAISDSSIIGIIEGNDNNVWSKYIRCIDSYNILEYFPGYFEKKELWDYWKVHTVEHRVFVTVIRGEYPNYLEDRKKQNNMFDYEDKGDIVKESEQTKDKGVNVTIESKDQIITVNIKDKTKQGNIEDSWN